MPSDSEPVCVEPAPEAQLFQGMALQESFSRTQDFSSGLIDSTQKINDMSYKQLISDPSTYVKKRCTTIRRFDPPASLVGTGPEEHLMSDFEHMTGWKARNRRPIVVDVRQ